MTKSPLNTPSGPLEEKLDLARAGDAQAINELFEQFYPRVQSMVHHSLATDLRRSRPWLSAKFSTGDVVQEVFRAVLKDLSVFAGKSEQSFVSYLAMVVRNRIIDTIRFHEAELRDGRRGAPPVIENETSSKSSGPVEEAIAADALDRFHAALAEFSERERLLLRSRFEGTASFVELAEQLGYSSVYSARRAYFSAQARLSARLRPEEEGGRP